MQLSNNKHVQYSLWYIIQMFTQKWFILGNFWSIYKVNIYEFVQMKLFNIWTDILQLISKDFLYIDWSCLITFWITHCIFCHEKRTLLISSEIQLNSCVQFIRNPKLLIKQIMIHFLFLFFGNMMYCNHAIWQTFIFFCKKLSKIEKSKVRYSKIKLQSKFVISN